MVSDGLVLIDKPAGWTSHDVVGRARRLYGTRKVGHAGTLDPMATGLLILGVGRGTKLLTFLVGCDKTYLARIRLGQATTTDDAEGEVVSTASEEALSALTDAAVGEVVSALTGAIEQVPSSVSAIKIDGKRSYARVRGGEDVTLPARPVTVHDFTVGSLERGSGWVDLDATVTVSSGTYVRALARDLGWALGVGGHLTALRRTQVGGYRLEDAHDLSDLATLLEEGRPMPLTPLGAAAAGALAVRQLTPEQARSLGFGQRIESEQPGRQEPVAAMTADGTLVAVLDESRSTARAHVVFAPASS